MRDGRAETTMLGISVSNGIIELDGRSADCIGLRVGEKGGSVSSSLLAEIVALLVLLA